MHALLLEFLRFNNLTTGIWREGDPYLATAGSDSPIRQFASPLDHEGFLTLITALRYEKDAARRVDALTQIGAIAATLLGSESLTKIASGPFPLQLDLVVNPAEVAALPFEAATDSEGRPLFARDDAAVVVTRRVRHAFAETQARWPATPRVLYAWAPLSEPGDVPSQEHAHALRTVLEPWAAGMLGTSDPPESVLKVLGETTLEQIEEACRAAVEAKTPFTHVHLLAHGVPIGEAPSQHFGIGIPTHDGAAPEATPEQLGKALAPLLGHAVIITLATCDAANLTNTITSKRSIAHALHELGFPIVVASQFPFTKLGSTLMLQTFYQALLGGEDVRVALHKARVALYGSREQTGHDWASLVGYARLPEGYADHLLDVRLECMLASLKTMQGWSDELVQRGNTDPALFDRVATQLQERIATLERFVQETAQAGRSGVIEENLGLLGSAEKRLAELLYCGPDSASRSDTVRDALKRARDWYRQGFYHNISTHWNGVQYLSLDAVLDGHIVPSRWFAAVTAAEIDSEQPSAIWALASLLEIYLLAPFAGQSPQLDLARKALLGMKERAYKTGSDTFPLESTGRQLRRYVHWWTNANGFFPNTCDLSAQAKEMLDELGHNG